MSPPNACRSLLCEVAVMAVAMAAVAMAAVATAVGLTAAAAMVVAVVAVMGVAMEAVARAVGLAAAVAMALMKADEGPLLSWTVILSFDSSTAPTVANCHAVDRQHDSNIKHDNSTASTWP